MRGLFLIFFFYSALTAHSQSLPERIEFDHLTLPGAINSSQVNDVIQDKYGLIWIAGDGLFRYDGLNFKTYKLLPDSSRIDSKEINVLYYDTHNDRLLIGTHSYGVVEYNYATDQFRRLPTVEKPPIVSHIIAAKNGDIWVNSFSDGLHYIKNDSLLKFNIYQLDDHFGSNPTSVLATDDGLWLDHFKVLYKVKNNQIIDSILLKMSGVDLPLVTRITALYLDRKENLWIGTERAGVFRYNTQQKKFTKHLTPDQAPFFNRITSIFEDSRGLIWILAKSNGIALYSPEEDKFTKLKKNILDEKSLSGDNCTSVMEDDSGIIWVGALGGLNRYDPFKLRFRHINQNPFAPVSLTDNMVRGIYEDKFHKVWIGTDGGTLHVFDRAKNTIEKIPASLPGASQHFVPAYFQDLNENILLIGSSQGLLQYNRQTKKINYYEPLREITQGRMVRQLILNDNYLHFIHSGSLYKHNLTTKKTEQFTNFTSDQYKRVINATTLHLDNQQRIWLGVSGGVSLYNNEINSFKYFPLQKKDTRNESSYFMILSLEDFDGKLWIGTFNSGLWYFDLNNLDNPEITILTEKDGLSNNTVYSTIPDKGNLWITTNRGISKYIIKEDRFINFSVTEGLQQEEFNRLAFERCEDGEIIVGGINGINLFHPDKINLREVDYSPKLLSLRVVESDNTNTFHTLLNESNITLDYKQNEFEVNFFVPKYQDPKRYETFYKLLNHDREWNKVESNSIHYSNIESGEYKLQIKTVSVSGKEQLLNLPITITPPFYESGWFIGVAAAVVALLVITIIQSYSKKAKLDKERLEVLLRDRTKEIARSREDLANLNQKKDLIFSILSHDLRAPLTTLKGFLTVLIDGADTLSKEEVKKHAISIRNSVTSSLDLIDNTLFWSLSQTGNITYTPSTFSLKEMVTKIISLYQLTAEKKHLTIQLDEVSESLKVYADENMVYVTLRNIVSNALKFTPEGKSITLKLSQNHQMAEIRVIDEGVGMSNAYLKKLMAEEQLQLKKGTSNEKGTGLGIALCKKFVQMNKGYIEINSEENKGTEFIVKLPLSSVSQ